MGVKDFVILRNAMENIQKSQIPKFDVLLVDGSNLIIMILMRHVSQLFKNFETFPFGGSKLNLLDQVNYLIFATVHDIEEFVKSAKRYYKTITDIFIVFDPIETPKYFVKMCWDYVDILYPEDANDIEKTIIADFKLDEQHKRNAGQTYEEFCKQNKESLANFIKESSIIDEELIEILTELREQSMFFKFNRNALKLSKRVINELTNTEFEDNVLLIRGKYEADLVIKNIANELDKNKNILVASRDADYFFLFSDFENVFCVDIVDMYSPHHPQTIFKNLLGECFSYEAVCRISPLLGNDYTAHSKSIINCKKYENISKLFNLNNSMKTISRRDRNLYALINNCQAKDLLTPEDIDELVLKYDLEYFKLYWKSILVYSHWELYNDYEVLEFVQETTFPLPFKSIILFKSEYYDNNWEEFKKSITKLSIDSAEIKENKQPDLLSQFAEETVMSAPVDLTQNSAKNTEQNSSSTPVDLTNISTETSERTSVIKNNKQTDVLTQFAAENNEQTNSNTPVVLTQNSAKNNEQNNPSTPIVLTQNSAKNNEQNNPSTPIVLTQISAKNNERTDVLAQFAEETSDKQELLTQPIEETSSQQDLLSQLTDSTTSS